MDTAGRRSMQSHGLTRHIHRDERCWSARASNVVALAHSLFLLTAPRRLAVRLFLGGLMADPARNMLPNFTDLGQGRVRCRIARLFLAFGMLLLFALSAAAATIPGAPQNLGASAGNGQNSLSWSAPSSNGGPTITSYRVFRGTTSSNRQIVTSGGCSNLGRYSPARTRA